MRRRTKYFLQASKSTLAKARALRKRMTPEEKILWSRIRNNGCGVHFRKQVPFGPYILDFFVFLIGSPQNWMAINISKVKQQNTMQRVMNICIITVLRFFVFAIAKFARTLMEFYTFYGHIAVQHNSSKRVMLSCNFKSK